MAKYIIKRLLLVIPTVVIYRVCMCFLSLTLHRETQEESAGPTATQEQVDMLNESLGVNRPLLVRYGEYIWNALHGDFGTSYTFNVPVTSVLMPKFPTTLKLAVLSVVFSALLGIPLGILSAVKKHSLLDHMLTVIALFLASVPGFWLGLMFDVVFTITIGTAPEQWCWNMAAFCNAGYDTCVAKRCIYQ